MLTLQVDFQYTGYQSSIDCFAYFVKDVAYTFYEHMSTENDKLFPYYVLQFIYYARRE